MPNCLNVHKKEKIKPNITLFWYQNDTYLDDSIWFVNKESFYLFYVLFKTFRNVICSLLDINDTIIFVSHVGLWSF